MKVPPSNNMGAQITAPVSKPFKNQILIDWFAFTVKLNDPHQVIEKFGLDFLDFSPCEYGGMGYKQSLRAGHIVVFFDGAENMGCHISMSGQGCRQFEAHKNKEHCWYQLFVMICAMGATVTRMDIAHDNIDGLLDLRRLEWNIRRKRVRSIFKGGQKIEKFSFEENPKKQGKTIYLGSPSSRLKIRFYDKAAQLDIDGHWTRAEFQLMAERAQEAVNHLMKSVTLGQLFSGVMNHYFTIINLDDSNKSRCSTQEWWSVWLEQTGKLKLTTMKAIKLVDEVMEHVKKQYAATFAMFKKYLGVAAFTDYVHELVNVGKTKMKTKHELIIQSSLITCELPF